MRRFPVNSCAITLSNAKNMSRSSFAVNASQLSLAAAQHVSTSCLSPRYKDADCAALNEFKQLTSLSVQLAVSSSTMCNVRRAVTSHKHLRDLYLRLMDDARGPATVCPALYWQECNVSVM
jgi:hypothetical protein